MRWSSCVAVRRLLCVRWLLFVVECCLVDVACFVSLFAVRCLRFDD